jgi:hypothetical protein
MAHERMPDSDGQGSVALQRPLAGMNKGRCAVGVKIALYDFCRLCSSLHLVSQMAMHVLFDGIPNVAHGTRLAAAGLCMRNVKPLRSTYVT